MKSRRGSGDVPFAGLILAGGQGVRWGGPKAWARLPDGRCFVDACVSVLGESGASPVAATLPPDTIAESVRVPEAVILPSSGLDMFASLKLGLERLLSHARWSAVVVLPVDHPLVTPAAIASLVGAGPPAAIPTLAGRHGHPVCLWRQVAERVVGNLRGSTNLREVLREAGAVDVPVTDRGVRANCNTPEALKSALRDLRETRRQAL